MVLPASVPAVLPLVASLTLLALNATLAPLDVGGNGVFAVLLSPNRNISLLFRDRQVFADSSPITKSPLVDDRPVHFSAFCLNDFALRLAVDDESRVIPSPSLCRRNSTGNKFVVGPDDSQWLFRGCVRDVALGPQLLLTSWCRSLKDTDDSPTSAASEVAELLYSDAASGHRPLQPVYVGDPIRVLENDSILVQWRNFYLFPEHRRFRIANDDVVFDIVDQPQHGSLVLVSPSGHRIHATRFTYSDLVERRLFYEHDGSENTADSFDIQVAIANSKVDFGDLRHRTYTIKVLVEPRNDPPQIALGAGGRRITLVPGVRVPLTENNVKVWDADSPTDQVFIRVKSPLPSVRFFSIYRSGLPLTRFSMADLLNRKIVVQLDSRSSAEASPVSVDLDAVDSAGATSSTAVTLEFVPSGVDFHLQANTGLQLPHKGIATFTRNNLAFSVASDGSEVGLALGYVVVDQPEFGIIECQRRGRAADFQMCSAFNQTDIDDSRVRYRHTSENRPSSDVFTFKVLAGDFDSPTHDFRIDFVSVSVRVFMPASLVINNTDTGLITRDHLLATTFPSTFQPDQLIYHVVEPPKFGILSRRLEGNRNRRIGVSSNFSQAHIDEGRIFYKLHFVHYNVVNDFVTFRLVTPAVTSELLRFDVTYVPGGNSIQTTNRTLIVPEGGSQTISNNTLWVETPDDTTFDFTVVLPPFNGQLVMVNEEGAKFVLGAGDSFDSRDIASRRLFYEHSGDEAWQDRIALVVESRHRPNTKLPLTLTVQVIQENDHAPELLLPGNEHAIYVVEKNERTLLPCLFPWKDVDVGSRPLAFTFPETALRDFVFFTKSSPPLPVRRFTVDDLRQKRLVVRHLGLKKTALVKYTVSDGKHQATATIRFMAQEPFVKLERAIIRLDSGPADGLVPLGPMNVSAQSNLDVDLAAIEFSVDAVGASPFKLLENGVLRTVRDFRQKDVDELKIFVAMQSLTEGQKPISMNLRVLNLETTAHIEVQKTAATVTTRFHLQHELVLDESAVAVIDESVIKVDISHRPHAVVKFVVTKQPGAGALVLSPANETSKSALVSTSKVWGFHPSDVTLRRLRYVHQRPNITLGKYDDAFSFKVIADRVSYGPFTIFVRKRMQLAISLRIAADLRCDAAGNSTLDQRHVKLQTALAAAPVTLRVAKAPNHGQLAFAHNPTVAIQTFSVDQLGNGEVVYFSTAKVSEDELSLVACIKESVCTKSEVLKVLIDQPNLLAPEIVKNEKLVIRGEATSLTTSVINASDADSPPRALVYVLGEASNGHVAFKSAPTVPVGSFTQAELQSGEVLFVAQNDTTKGGFSFLLSDGLHQTAAEYFVFERSSKNAAVLETNARLVTAPLQHAVVSEDVLKAVIGSTPPEKVTFSVVRQPVHGRLFRDRNKMVLRFTQADINARRISYQSDAAQLGAWLQKDYFTFVVHPEGHDASDMEASKFRVLLTFGALTSEALSQFVSVPKSLSLGKGQSIALNSSILDLSGLEDACGLNLVVEVLRVPRYVRLDLVAKSPDQSGSSSESVDSYELSGASTKPLQLPAEELVSGRHVILHADEEGDGEMLFSVFPASEKIKKSNRLRVALPIEVSLSLRVPNPEIVHFRPEITLVSGGATTLEPDDFLAEAAVQPPTEVIYRVVQRGSNGVRVVVLDEALDGAEASFSQAQVNKGQVRIEHTPLSSDDRFDVLVLAIGADEGPANVQYRALIVRVEPLALHLFNHTDISYLQGKTYVVLHRGHLGADSNGDRSKIVYNVTEPPQNGTFYWVAGEREATSFTQTNIDNGDVLYAQLNMDAFQDSFAFTVGNDEMELLHQKSEIRVLPAVEAQDLVADAKTVTQVTPGYLNASTLVGKIPRFLVLSTPRFGRLFLHPTPNESAVFFTQADVDEGRLFYHAFDVHERTDEQLSLELRADGVQPARFTWHVDIRPIDKRLGAIQPGGRKKVAPGTDDAATRAATPRMTPELNEYFPLFVMAGIVGAVIVALCCRRSSKKKKKEDAAAAADKMAPTITRNESGMQLQLNITDNDFPLAGSTRGVELLDTTVYASVGGAPGAAGPTRRKTGSVSFEPTVSTFDPDSGPNPPHVRIAPLRRGPGSAFKATPLASLAAAAAARAKSPSPTDETVSGVRLPAAPSQLRRNQYWV